MGVRRWAAGAALGLTRRIDLIDARVWLSIVTHVHGAVGVGDESDGYAEAWLASIC